MEKIGSPAVDRRAPGSSTAGRQGPQGTVRNSRAKGPRRPLPKYLIEMIENGACEAFIDLQRNSKMYRNRDWSFLDKLKEDRNDE